MRNNTETLVDENGIELLVNYDYEKSDGEDGLYLTELKSVEIVIAGTGIDILGLMNEKQKGAIISKLQYE